MNNLILLILCFIAGMLLHRFKRMPVNTPAVLNSVILHVSLPALTLLSVHGLKIGGDVGLMAAMGWLNFAMSAGFFWLVGRWLDLPRPTVGALILTGGLGNTAYVGLPMIEAYYGHQALASGIIVDQLGSFLALSTLGITFAGLYSSGRPGLGDMAKRVFRFPPFIALLLALVLIPFEYPEWLTIALRRLSDTMAPLALLAVGFQLRLGHLAGNGRNLAIGLAFKLVLAPLVLFLLYVPLLGAHGQAIQITLFQAAMPPMITAAILATEHDLDPPLATLMTTVGLMLSFVTLAGWWWLMQGV
ncbi:membrane transport protein [mine drainage metagenome]|uniref:Membrane transport protein n=1 Tax=mine drainage metagenome TaxID=410659 RepID=A0A1J5U6B0_9ZZZZ